MPTTASPTVTPRVPRILLPREHGAYGQLLFPMATALVIGNHSGAAFALAGACAAAFVGHEAVLTLLGHRGGRAARQRRGDALFSLGCCAALTVLPGAWAFAAMTPASRVSAALPVVLAALLAGFIWSRSEHTSAGEVVAGIALSSCGVPIARAGDITLSRALLCWAVFALSFTVATLAVRSTIARIKDRDVVGSGAGGRISLPLTLAATTIALSILAAFQDWIPPAAALALLPVCGMAVGLSLFPPHPRHLRAVGWSLVTATALTAIVLAVAE